MQKAPDKFLAFSRPIDGIELPEKFTFPFFYQPHPLSLVAAEELKDYIESQVDWTHNFGLKPEEGGMKIGKMFGVLVVQDSTGNLGYLAAFSGKLGNSNDYEHFVPPVYDILKADGFYRSSEKTLYAMSDEIQQLEQSQELYELKKKVVSTDAFCSDEMINYKSEIKSSKEERKQLREQADHLPDDQKDTILEELRLQSVKQQYFLKDLIKKHKELRSEAQANLDQFLLKISELKKTRKQLSNDTQDNIFKEYHFLNANGETKNVLELFAHIDSGNPPSGAGECCAPKLLHYAYQHQLKPICLAEFWWGAAPPSEVRTHLNFYPACRGKCEPILSHMLVGLEMDENPLLVNPAIGKELEILFEDEVVVVVNKPAEFLSVPGKTISDSVLTRMQAYLPNATGPLLIHRLDMSTSGILLVAKTKEAHDYIQYQFIHRYIKKRYIAVLDGIVEEKGGLIDLPLRVDLDDRPRQLVCYEHGKTAQTEWELIEAKDGKSKVYFYPITGRTHQLRVHAAHPRGLGIPIIGDDLYGIRSSRLCLHAEMITFKHPLTKELITITAPDPFL